LGVLVVVLVVVDGEGVGWVETVLVLVVL